MSISRNRHKCCSRRSGEGVSEIFLRIKSRQIYVPWKLLCRPSSFGRPTGGRLHPPATMYIFSNESAQAIASNRYSKIVEVFRRPSSKKFAKLEPSTARGNSRYHNSASLLRPRRPSKPVRKAKLIRDFLRLMDETRQLDLWEAGRLVVQLTPHDVISLPGRPSALALAMARQKS